jgi:hypothetical protein
VRKKSVTAHKPPKLWDNSRTCNNGVIASAMLILRGRPFKLWDLSGELFALAHSS